MARLLLDVGTVGEIRRTGGAFVAELRGLMQDLDVERGRTYRATCGADLGDGRCRVNLADPRFRTTGTVTSVPTPTGLAVTLAGSFPDSWFDGGRLTWTTGANAGLAADIRSHGRGRLVLWEVPPRAPVTGEASALTAGCDKHHSTSRDRFDNVPNFQGFPHMPGNDFVLRYAPGSGPGLDGGSLFR